MPLHNKDLQKIKGWADEHGWEVESEDPMILRKLGRTLQIDTNLGGVPNAVRWIGGPEHTSLGAGSTSLTRIQRWMATEIKDPQAAETREPEVAEEPVAEEPVAGESVAEESEAVGAPGTVEEAGSPLYAQVLPDQVQSVPTHPLTEVPDPPVAETVPPLVQPQLLGAEGVVEETPQTPAPNEAAEQEPPKPAKKAPAKKTGPKSTGKKDNAEDLEANRAVSDPIRTSDDPIDPV